MIPIRIPSPPALSSDAIVPTLAEANSSESVSSTTPSVTSVRAKRTNSAKKNRTAMQRDASTEAADGPTQSRFEISDNVPSGSYVPVSVRRECTARLEEEMSSSPSQQASSVRQVVRKQLVQDPMRFPRISTKFFRERCLGMDTPPGRTKDLEKKNKECREYAEKYPRPHLVNTMGQRTHIKCRDCPWWSHSLHNNHYYHHINHTCLVREGQRIANEPELFSLTPNDNSMSVNVFVRRCVPCLVAKTNLSCKAAHALLRNYEELRPKRANTEEILNALGNNHRVMRDWEKDLANEIWEKMISKIDIHPFFGVAVDAGVDSVLNEHVLVGVVYVSDEQYLLPPMYHPKRKAFNGKETAESLVNTLNSILGITLVRKMRFLMVDGCAVNHVARDEAEGELKRIYDRVQRIGESDWINFGNRAVDMMPHVSLLSCFGHFLNNLAMDAMKPFQETPLFELKKLFRQTFYGHDKICTKKGRYRGVALDVLLGSFDEETNKAEQFFTQWYGGLSSNKLDDEYQTELVCQLRSSVQILKQYAPDEADIILAELNAQHENIPRCRDALSLYGPQVIEAVRRAKDVHGITAPKLGGVTRWCHDKFSSISFFSTQLPTVVAFLKQELENPRVCQSVRKCADLIAREGVDNLATSAKYFLEELAPIQKALQKFSDLDGTPLATGVWPTLERLRKASRVGSCSEAFECALKHHINRLSVHHNMKYWEDVMWFAPDFIALRARKAGLEPIHFSRANDLFRGGSPIFQITENEWNEYVNCVDYEWDSRVHKCELHWWQTVGVYKYPGIHQAAIHYLWVPPLVTKCDSWMSVMNTKYNSRQSSMGTQTVQNSMLLRGNYDKLGYLDNLEQLGSAGNGDSV